MQLYYPIKPLQLNQGFGANPEYYKKFLDVYGNPYKGHDGMDFRAITGQEVRAAHAGMARLVTDSHGGEGIMLRSLEAENDGTFATTMYWHLIGDSDINYPSPISTDNREHPVEIGQLIGYADNTGAPFESSGTHLHFGLYFSGANGVGLHQNNGFNGRVDPAQYFTGTYAEDEPLLVQKYQMLISILQKCVELLTAKK